MIGEPPFDAGAVQVTVAFVFPGEALTPVGAPGGEIATIAALMFGVVAPAVTVTGLAVPEELWLLYHCSAYEPLMPHYSKSTV